MPEIIRFQNKGTHEIITITYDWNKSQAICILNNDKSPSNQLYFDANHDRASIKGNPEPLDLKRDGEGMDSNIKYWREFLRERYIEADIRIKAEIFNTRMAEIGYFGASIKNPYKPLDIDDKELCLAINGRVYIKSLQPIEMEKYFLFRRIHNVLDELSQTLLWRKL